MPYVLAMPCLGGPRLSLAPNAGAHLLPEAAARHEQRLEAVRCSAWLGAPPPPRLGGRLPHGPPAESHTRHVVVAVPSVLNALCLECLMSWRCLVLEVPVCLWHLTLAVSRANSR